MPWCASGGAPDLSAPTCSGTRAPPARDELLAGLLPACSSPVAAVVHCAAAVGDFGPPEWFERVNVGGTAAVLAVAEALDATAVVVSSGSVYDHRTPARAIGEDHAQGGWVTAYGRTKAAADALAVSAGARVLRPHAVYGPGDRYLLPRVTAAVRLGQLVLPGDDVTLSVTHVRTLTSAALAATAVGRRRLQRRRRRSRQPGLAAGQCRERQPGVTRPRQARASRGSAVTGRGT